MRKPLPIQLSIPAPCSENWEAMTPDAQGRFCSHCRKSVIDFTGWSDTALYEFFSENTASVCGRMLHTQLGRTIHIPSQPHSKLYRIVIALGLTILIAQAQETRARMVPPLVEQSIFTPANDADADTAIIRGQVLDDKREPIIGAMVQLENAGHALNGTVTDINGNFSISISDSSYKQLKKSNIQLRIQLVGYLIKVVNLKSSDFSADQFISVKMDPPATMGLTAVTVTVENKPPIITPQKSGPNKTFTTKDIHNMGY